MAKLVIVESPAKAKTIGKYLGKDYEVTASMGTSGTCPSPSWASTWNMTTPPSTSISRINPSSSRSSSKSQAADGILLATDPDREAKPSAGIWPISWGWIPTSNRVTFDEITKRACRRAWPIPVPLMRTCSMPSRPAASSTVWWL